MTVVIGRGSEARAEIALTVNGSPRRVAQAVTVAEYLASLSIDPRAVVIEHNGEILRDRDSLSGIRLSEGDQLEIVHFVGGG
jgi:thiamine biosynthesis protein ThiS